VKEKKILEKMVYKQWKINEKSQPTKENKKEKGQKCMKQMFRNHPLFHQQETKLHDSICYINRLD
jgi:hypothetical protein